MTMNVLIPDGNSTWALSVINCLAEQSDIHLFVLSNKKRTATKFSRYTYYYKFYPKADDTSWVNIINKEIQDNNIDIVVPVAEEEIGFFIKNIKLISSKAKVISLPNWTSFDIAINKRKLGDFSVENNIPYPNSLFIKDLDSLVNNNDVVNFPVLLKPLKQKGGDGIIKFNSKVNLQSYISENPSEEGYFIQEYINGYDIDCSVLCLNGEILTHTIQKGYLPGHSPYAPHLGVTFVENDDVFRIVKHLMKTLNWSGVAHIDLRFDNKTKTYYVLEINARFWGSVEASKFAGVNFPLLVCELAKNNNIETKAYKHIDYMRFKGVLKYIKKHPSFIFNLNFILNNTETKSVLADPTPTLYKFLEWSKRHLF